MARLIFNRFDIFLTLSAFKMKKMKTTISCNWVEGMAFESQIGKHKIIMDVDEKAGGSDSGPRPKPLMLSALAGCSGMDVVSIIKKMRVEISSFRMEVEGELTEEHPKYYKTIHIIYIFKAPEEALDQLKKAVELSLDKYCGVSAQLKLGVPVTHSVILE